MKCPKCKRDAKLVFYRNLYICDGGHFFTVDVAQLAERNSGKVETPVRVRASAP